MPASDHENEADHKCWAERLAISTNARNGQPRVAPIGLNRIAALEPAEPMRRYERDRPGEQIHIDSDAHTGVDDRDKPGHDDER